jgi:copper resistance protein C
VTVARGAGTARWGVRRRLLALALLLLVLLASPASAHTSLVGSVPAAGSAVESVTEVVLVFDDGVQPDLSTVAVTGPDGVDRSSGAPVLRQGNQLVQGLDAPLGDGRWTVAYRVVARDGHPVAGSHDFQVTVTSAAAVTPPPAPSPTAEVATPVATDQTGGGGVPLLPVALGGLLLAGVLGAVAGRRGSGSLRA